MADVLESNRNEIAKFLAKKISAEPNYESDEAWVSESSVFDWSHYFAFVSRLERGSDEVDPGYEVRSTILVIWGHFGPIFVCLIKRMLELRTREGIKAVRHCDITQPCGELLNCSGLREGESQIDAFAVIIASLILDVVATDLKTFRDALSNIQDILLPG